MINFRLAKKYCSEDITTIENYEKAALDAEQTWHLHHRKETDEGLSGIELQRRDLYYYRPASELIFLDPSEHMRLHRLNKKPWNKGKKTGALSKEHKEKIKESCKGGNSTTFRKGQIAWNKGKKMSEEQKKKISAARKGKAAWNKGKLLSEETKKKISETKLKKHKSV